VRAPPRARAGFTLAEVAVTLLIVSMGLVLVMQGLTGAKHSAATTHYRKLARELGGLTLGQLEAGLFWEDLQGGSSSGDVLTGNYAEEGHEEFSYELVLGDEQFSEESESYGEDGAYHDTWAYQRDREREREDDDDEEESTVTEPFQKARIRVTFPRLGETDNTLVIERWIPWELVYGSEGDNAKPAEESGEGDNESGP
jgi:prepilin-type N-terminal cleavage/methylation domain-containing protein